ncbi:MAG: hypothetical protein KBS95_06130 [Alistipes sp.]|nr:hypothetical protein [Candidatus Alistipes equi]
MKNLFRSLMLVAIVAMAFVSCTKDLAETENKSQLQTLNKHYYNLQVEALLNDTRVACDNEGKLSWMATDSIGVVLVGYDESGEDDSNVDVCAKTDAEACKAGKFVADSVSVVSGKMYAYYPYTPYNNPEWTASSCLPNKNADGVPTVNEESIWVVLKQSQHQSVAGAQEFGNYFTMAAEGVDFSKDKSPALSFSPLASVLCFDIYDSSSKYTSANIRNVIATVVNDTDTPLVGGYKYNLVGKSFDFTTGGRRCAGAVIVDTPFAVPSASGQGLLYMAVLPGTRTLKITVNTDKGSHVLTMANPITSNVAKKGTIKVNLSNAAVEHYILYQDYDLLNWGGDLMYQKIPVGEYWCPLCDNSTRVGKVAAATMNGEEPFYFVTSDYNTDGTAAFTSVPEIYLIDKNLDGWEYSKVYEHPGYIKCGTGSAGFSITTPKLLGIGAEPMNVEFSFKVVHRYSCNDNIVVSVIGPGTVEGVEAKTVELVKPAAYTDVPGCITTETLTLMNVTNETQIKIENENVYPSAARTNFDEFKVTFCQGAIELPPVSVDSIQREFTDSSFTLTWDAVPFADKYKYQVCLGDELLVEDVVTTTSLTYNGFEQGKSYTVKFQCVSDNSSAYLPSEWASCKVATDVTPSGTVLFFDNLDWLTQEAIGATATETICQDGGSVPVVQEHGYSVPSKMAYGEGAGLSNRVYARVGYFKIGRGAHDAGCNGELFLPVKKMFQDMGIPEGAEIDIVLTASTCAYSKLGKKLFVILDNGDGPQMLLEYTPKTAGSAITEETADNDMEITIEKVRIDSKICLSTAWETGVKDNRIFYDNIKIVKK